MKYDMYELFSEYEGELPEIEEGSCDTERIKRLALQGIEKKKHRIRTKVFVIGIAAAALSMTGITVAANSDAFARFRNILHRTEKDNIKISSELPLISDDDIEGMEENISEEKVFFTGSDSMEVSTAGMYYDNNTLMLSVEMKLKADVEIPAGSLVIPHYVIYKDGAETELSDDRGDLSNAAVLVKGDEPDSYYATFYVTDRDIAGSTVEVCLKYIIDPVQPQIIWEMVGEEQDKWREEFGADLDTPVEEWKQIWREQDLDRRTRDFENSCLDECDKVLVGNWTAQISIPADTAKTITAEKDGFKVTADTLSIAVDCSRDLSPEEIIVPIITMKDGTVIFTDYTSVTVWFSEWIVESGICPSPDSHEEIAYRWGNIYSYSRPHPVEDIADITVYVIEHHDEDIRAEGYVMYESEGEN